MAKASYKSIVVEYFEDRERVALMFQERNFTDTKWLTLEELKKFKEDIELVLKENTK